MKRNLSAVLAAALLALTCTEPSPSVGGTWRLTSSLTYPPDFDIAPGQPEVCADTGVLTLSGGAAFSGTYDSLTIACNTGSTITGINGLVINGALASGTVSFNFDTPDWLYVGTVHGDSMGGTVTDSLNGMPGWEAATGSWSACESRTCGTR
jgi:hypothetical protein